MNQAELNRKNASLCITVKNFALTKNGPQSEQLGLSFSPGGVTILAVPLAFELSSESSIQSHGDGTKADEGKRGEDEDAEHVGVGHEDDQEELSHVKELLEGALDSTDDSSVFLLDLLLLNLKVFHSLNIR